MVDEANSARRWFVALSAAPILVCIVLAFAFAYDAPYWDQWMFVTPIAKAFDGTLGLSDFVVHVNEHVYITPNFITIPLARLTHWDIRAEIAVTLLFYVATFGLFVAQLRKVDGKGSMWAAPVIACALFSFAQHAVWNWGLHVSLAMAVFFVVLAIMLLSAENAGWWAVGGAMVAAWVATFSIGGGVAVWPAGLVIIFAVRMRPLDVQEILMRWNRFRLWMLSMVVAGTVYSAISTGDPAKLTIGILDVPSVAIYVLAFLGGPIAALSGWFAVVAGCVGVYVCVVQLRSSIAGPVRRFVLGLATAAIVAGGLTALKHSHEGVENAISSRFLAWGTLAWCGLAIAAYAKWPTVRAMPRGVRALVALVFVGVLVSSAYGAYKAEERHDAFMLGRRALIEDPASPDMRFIHPEPETLGERRELLIKYRLTVFRDEDAE